MRKSKVENKYNLTFGDLKKLKIGNFSNKKTFFRNDVINAWCGYNFTHFFKQEEMDCELDLEIQEKLLAKINWLIDKHILER